MKLPILTILLGLFIFSCSNKSSRVELPPVKEKTLEYWPTASWKYDTSSYSEQFNYLTDSFPGRYSLLIVKDGQIVFEYYQESYAKDSLIQVNSCTKTVISMLFGMVFKDSLEYNENKAAIDYFPNYSISDPLAKNIKTKHFLSMTSGMAWRGGIDATDVIQMSETNDWAKYVFGREMVGVPGTKFHYNSGGSQVTSTLLHKKTKEGLMNYATDNLFNPIGISQFKWDSTMNGIPKAGWGLHLKIEDLAKLGYLLLRKGKWENAQIIPEEWVLKMSDKHTEANDTYDYGYQVWIPKGLGTKCFMFRGSYPPSTKIVTVLPELNSVVVYVGENYKTNKLLKDFIIPELKKN